MYTITVLLFFGKIMHSEVVFSSPTSCVVCRKYHLLCIVFGKTGKFSLEIMHMLMCVATTCLVDSPDLHVLKLNMLSNMSLTPDHSVHSCRSTKCLLQGCHRKVNGQEK